MKRLIVEEVQGTFYLEEMWPERGSDHLPPSRFEMKDVKWYVNCTDYTQLLMHFCSCFQSGPKYLPICFSGSVLLQSVLSPPFTQCHLNISALLLLV